MGECSEAEHTDLCVPLLNVTSIHLMSQQKHKEARVAYDARQSAVPSHTAELSTHPSTHLSEQEEQTQFRHDTDTDTSRCWR